MIYTTINLKCFLFYQFDRFYLKIKYEINNIAKELEIIYFDSIFFLKLLIKKLDSFKYTIIFFILFLIKKSQNFFFQ